jgi:hypothetical protein
MLKALDLVRSETIFDPETVNILADALEKAWQRIEARGDRLARPAYASATREVIASYIIDMATGGERDPGKLSDAAVEYLAANYKA